MPRMTDLLAAVSDRDRELHRRHAMLLFVLGLCSFVCCCTYLGRRMETGRHDYRFLIWNLTLAWAPLIFATIAHWAFVARGLVGRRLLILGCLTLWLLFFPNAPYLVSDLKHLAVPRRGVPLWFDSVMVGSFVLTGVMTGFASLVLVHDLARRRFGAGGGWTIITLASAASGFAVYLGRFVRLNSWDVFTRPMWSLDLIFDQVTVSTLLPKTLVTSGLYTTFILLGYVTILTLSHVAAATRVESARAK